MRKYLLILLVALTAASCATLRAPAKLERLVNRVERNADHYRPYQWDRVNREYEALLREYVNNYRTYTIAEKQRAMAAIGRYPARSAQAGCRGGGRFPPERAGTRKTRDRQRDGQPQEAAGKVTRRTLQPT